MCGQLTPEPELQARTERAPHRAPADGPPPDRPVTRGVYDGDRQAAPASPPRPPSRCRSLAARLQVTTQPPPPQPPPSPRARPARPLCVRHRILRRPSGKAPRPPARRRVPPRGGRRRRSPKVPRPPAAAASRTPRPGLLVQPQLRLLGRRRHLSLCGKTRPSGWSGASLGRSSPGPGAAGRVPPTTPSAALGPATARARAPGTQPGPPPTRPEKTPRNSQFGAVCVKPGRRWERAASPRHTPLARYAPRLQRPPPLPAFRRRPRCPRRRRAAFPPLPGRGPPGEAGAEPSAAQRGARCRARRPGPVELRACVRAGAPGPARPPRGHGRNSAPTVLGCPKKPNKVTSPQR